MQTQKVLSAGSLWCFLTKLLELLEEASLIRWLTKRTDIVRLTLLWQRSLSYKNQSGFHMIKTSVMKELT